MHPQTLGISSLCPAKTPFPAMVWSRLPFEEKDEEDVKLTRAAPFLMDLATIHAMSATSWKHHIALEWLLEQAAARSPEGTVAIHKQQADGTDFVITMQKMIKTTILEVISPKFP